MKLCCVGLAPATFRPSIAVSAVNQPHSIPAAGYGLVQPA